MCHSSQFGFVGPPSQSFRVGDFLGFPPPPREASRFVGVVCMRAYAGHLRMLGDIMLSAFVGVGKCRIGGKYPHPRAVVPRTIGARSEHAPLRIEPERGQIPENGIESPNSEICAVFHKDVSGSNFANHAHEFQPKSRLLALDARSTAGRADVLARESARNNIHSSSPRSPVEGADVIPDGKRWQDSVVLPFDEDLAAIRLDLDGANGPVSEDEPAENSASSACE